MDLEDSVNMSIEIMITEIAISIALGFIGAPTRMYAQHLNGKPVNKADVYARGFISAIAGLVYYLVTGWAVNDIRIIALGALVAGYAGVDFVENALGDKTG